MRVEDLTKFEGECPNIVVFGTYMDIRVPLTKKWKKIINERGDKPNTYHNCLISYLDKCDENGNLYGEGDIPCPFCNTEKFIEYDPFSKEDEFYEGIENEEKAKEMSREWYLNWINYMREHLK